MKHPYEYMMLCDFARHPGGGSRMLDFKDEMVQQSWAKYLGKRTEEWPKMINALPDDGGWEVNSHSITLLGETILTTILLQRRHT